MIKAYFEHNKEYSAEDINTVVGNLATGGVIAELTDGEINTPEALSALAGALATPGVGDHDYNGLKVTANEAGIVVSPGKAIMPNNAMIVSDESVVISAPAINGFVYLKYDTITGEYGFVFSETELTDAILLADITAEGEVTDRRTFSQTRLVPNSKNIICTITPGDEGVIDTGYNGWNGMIAYMTEYVYNSENKIYYSALTVLFEKNLSFSAVYYKKYGGYANTTEDVRETSVNTSSLRLRGENPSIKVKFTFENGKLYINDGEGYAGLSKLPVTVYMF